MLYQLYGLVIDIDDVLRRVPSVADVQVDIQVRCNTSLKRFLEPSDWFMHWYLLRDEPWLSFAKINNGYLLRFHQLADFFINGEGDQITYTPENGVPEETTHHLLLDQVIPLVINLKGGQALHVSAVLMPQGVVAFAGPTGSGKSTLSAWQS
jgi:ABC-type multidrug transport system fused ATPase/permease subunit